MCKHCLFELTNKEMIKGLKPTKNTTILQDFGYQCNLQYNGIYLLNYIEDFNLSFYLENLSLIRVIRLLFAFLNVRLFCTITFYKVN